MTLGDLMAQRATLQWRQNAAPRMISIRQQDPAGIYNAWHPWIANSADAFRDERVDCRVFRVCLSLQTLPGFHGESNASHGGWFPRRTATTYELTYGTRRHFPQRTKCNAVSRVVVREWIARNALPHFQIDGFVSPMHCRSSSVRGWLVGRSRCGWHHDPPRRERQTTGAVLTTRR